MASPSTDRRTVIRGVAWAAPAISIAAAAPALAASDSQPNLSTSEWPGGAAGGGTIRSSAVLYALLPRAFVNTGTADALGVAVTITSTVAIIAVSLAGSPPSDFGASVTGEGTTSIVLTLPSSRMTVPAGGSKSSALPWGLTFANGDETTLGVMAVALNGGVPWSSGWVLPVYVPQP